MNKSLRIITVLSLCAAFSLLCAFVARGGALGFEARAYAEITKRMNPALTMSMIFITNVGSLPVAIAALLLICPGTRFQFGIPVSITAVIASELNRLLKALIARDRPKILVLVAETGYGFPSGHAMNNAALYMMITLMVFRQTKNRKTRAAVSVAALGITVLIGISRVYLGVHNMADVLAGWAMGVAVALTVDTSFSIDAENLFGLCCKNRETVVY